jgi:Mrp family chromosome partitioning ATPase
LDTEPQIVAPQQTWIVSDLGLSDVLFTAPPLVVTPGAPSAPPRPNVAEVMEKNDAPLVADNTISSPPAEHEIRSPRQPSNKSRVATTERRPRGDSGTSIMDGSTFAAIPDVPAAVSLDSRTAEARTAETAAIDEEPAPPSSGVFQAAWEVDRFGWTPECDRLFATLTSSLDEAGTQLQAATAEGLRVMALCSAQRGEGRTSLALLLARAAAQAGVKVALIDADVDNPQLAANLRIQLETDWLAVLREDVPLEEAAVASLADGITSFALRVSAREQLVRLNEQAVSQLVSRISKHFELVVVDMGAYTTDPRRMFAAGRDFPIDAAIIVRDMRTTSHEQTENVARYMRNAGVQAVGIVENFGRAE